MHADLSPSKTPVWGPWHFNLGDHWATANYLLTRSWMNLEEQLLSRYQHGKDYKARWDEIFSLLNGPERSQVTLVDDHGKHEPSGYAVWATPFWPTKITWDPLAKHETICHQFDGDSNASGKNPPDEDLPRILGSLKGTPVKLGKHLSLAQCVEELSKAKYFVGCDSGMSHLAHSVGVPIIMVEYSQAVVTTHRRKHYTVAKGTDALIKVIGDWKE